MPRPGFRGGSRLPANKLASRSGPIRRCPLPPVLSLALGRTDAVVVPGQRVRRFERLARARDARTASLHAPAAGTVRAVGPARLELLVDDTDVPDATLPPLAWEEATAEALRKRLDDAGVAGLGGAAFPSATKLAGDAPMLILNGAECEPWIACDEALLLERADDVVRGGRVLRRVAGAARVMLAIEDAMPEGLRAAREAVAAFAEGEIEVVAVPTIYPQGGERQLIETLTGRQVPHGGLPRDIGVRVQNVATAAAAWRAVAHGEAMVSRLVSVTGPGVARPCTLEVAFGTPVSRLVHEAGGYTPQAARLIAGGPMTGRSLPDDSVPVDAGLQCVLVLGAAPLRDPAAALPCIRCGDCARACPASLLPQQLHQFLRAGDESRAGEHGLTACIECGLCDLACPSGIPLTEQFRAGKAAARQIAHVRALGDASRARHQAREARLAMAAEARARAMTAPPVSAASAVQAALERARARKKPDG